MLPIWYLKNMLGVNSPLTVRCTLGSQLTGCLTPVSLQAQRWRFITGAWLVGSDSKGQGGLKSRSSAVYTLMVGWHGKTGWGVIPPEAWVLHSASWGVWIACFLAANGGPSCMGVYPWEVLGWMAASGWSCHPHSMHQVWEGSLCFGKAYDSMWGGIFGSLCPPGWSFSLGSLRHCGRCWWPCAGMHCVSNSGGGIMQQTSGSPGGLQQAGASILLPQEWPHTVWAFVWPKASVFWGQPHDLGSQPIGGVHAANCPMKSAWWIGVPGESMEKEYYIYE